MSDTETLDHGPLREALKRVAAALKQADVPFALAGGYGAWVRGAPEPAHDVDFLVPGEHAEAAEKAVRAAGLEVQQPPEDWLFKVATDGVLVDVIFRSNSATPEQLLEAATEQPVLSVVMPVISATDVVSEKLGVLEEHYCDYAQVLPTLRGLREQVDWAEVERRSAGNPYAEALLWLARRLEIIG